MFDYLTANEQAYDLLASEYGQRVRHRSRYETTPCEFCERILEYVRGRNQIGRIRVLEIGPGAGDVSLCFSEQGCVTTAVELSGRMAAMTSEKSPLTIVHNKSITDMDFEPENFDVIYAGAVMHLFPKNTAANLLLKIREWLAPNGFFFVNTTVCDESHEGFYQKSDYKYQVCRFRKKWSFSEVHEFLLEREFVMQEILFHHEVDRGKFWAGFICAKTLHPES